MLRTLDIRAAPVAEPLLAASTIIAGTETTEILPLTFLRRGSKWLRHLTRMAAMQAVCGKSRFCSICGNPSARAMCGSPIHGGLAT